MPLTDCEGAPAAHHGSRSSIVVVLGSVCWSWVHQRLCELGSGRKAGGPHRGAGGLLPDRERVPGRRRRDVRCV